MKKEMEMAKNITKMEISNMKVNILMENGMEKENNIMKMGKYFLKVNI